MIFTIDKNAKQSALKKTHRTRSRIKGCHFQSFQPSGNFSHLNSIYKATNHSNLPTIGVSRQG